MHKHSLKLALLASAVLTACGTMAPQYQRPASPVADTWPQSTSQQGVAAASLPWRDYFADESLVKLIDLALSNNRDLRVAALNIEKARAQYQIQRASLFPAVNATAGETAQLTPAALSTTGHERISRQFSAGVGISSYELDFFGRIQSLKDQVLEQYLATEEAQRSARISLIAEVANGYLNLAADKERLQLAQATLQSQQDSLALVKRKVQLGAASALDLAQAQSGVESARADAARYTSVVAQDTNALTLVVGGAGAVDGLLPQSLADRRLTQAADLPAGTPGEVLLARPDVLQAERSLRAANANIGAARAAFFPRISLTASAGVASPVLSDLFQGSSQTWSFIPQISLPIFNAGANAANLDVAKIDREIKVAQYEKAIQGAFREVADALAQRSTVGEQLSAQESQTAALVEAHRLTKLRYDKGVSSYLNVLDAQRTMYSAQQGLITVRQARQANMISLYKVLGGGAIQPAS